MTTMFVQLRRVVYLLVLLQFCVCVARADGAEKTKAVNFLTKWADESEKQLAEGKSYQEVWNTTVRFCFERADKAKKVAEETKELVDGIDAEVKNRNGSSLPVTPELAKFVKNISEEVRKNMRVFEEAMDTVEKARKLVTWSSGAMQNMQDKLETQNNSRVYYTGVLKGIPEDNRTEEQELLIERSERIYKEMDEVYQRLQVISKQSVACSRETNQRVMDTKNKMLEAVKLFERVKKIFDLKSDKLDEKVNTYDEAVRESLKDDLPEGVTHEKVKEEDEKVIVGRASNSTIGGAAPLATKNRTVETTDLKEKLDAEKKKEEERLKQKKEEEEQELKRRIEERKRAEEERKRKEEEKAKRDAAEKAGDEKAKQAAQKAKEEAEKAKQG